jgi:methylated-DNA-[protein]-cysteine S-methyltransferase
MPTEFERLVYEKTSEIPKNRISTYGEIAKAISRPGAARAVGNSLNKNPTPIVVPCHRVIRSDMTLGGFAKGTDAKKQLLIAEGMKIVGYQVVGEPWTFRK